MLDPAEWLVKAQSLPLGGKSSIAHGCGTGRKLLIEHKEAGWAAWCYRCSEPGFVPKPKPSLAERIAKLSQQREVERRIMSNMAPPMPAVFSVDDWPDVAKVWLYKAGLDKDWIENIGFYWNPKLERVVMPVLSDLGSLVFWQARGFDPKRPKYLSPELGPGMFKPVYKAVPLRPDPGRRADTLVITEDILSAVRASEVAQGWSILGTSLTPFSEAEIVKFGASRVLVWLDPDEAGVNGRRKIVPRLRALGIDAKAVRADLDPKCYPIDEIRRKING